MHLALYVFTHHILPTICLLSPPGLYVLVTAHVAIYKLYEIIAVLIKCFHCDLQFEPVIQINNIDHVHHILVYKCHNLTNTAGEDNSAPCRQVHEEAIRCYYNVLIAGWAVGGGVRKLL